MAAIRVPQQVCAHPAAERRPPFGGLLPHRLLRWRRPVWWQELLLIALGYWLYTISRNAIPEQRTVAIRHGFSIERLQRSLHLNFELSVNQWVAAREWLAQVLDYYYATLHFLITGGVLLWLFLKRPHIYRGARTVLFATTIVALVGFAFYPVAPPRLLPGTSYFDTIVNFHTWGSWADPDIAAHSNQYAAMPSLHIGWALWAALSIFMCARTRWIRLLALGYPILTLIVIVATANHYLIDAVGGAVILAVGFSIQALLSGHGAYTPPFDAPDFGLPDPAPPTSHQVAAAC
jgi:hypothetical protein